MVRQECTDCLTSQPLHLIVPYSSLPSNFLPLLYSACRNSLCPVSSFSLYSTSFSRWAKLHAAKYKRKEMRSSRTPLPLTPPSSSSTWPHRIHMKQQTGPRRRQQREQMPASLRQKAATWRPKARLVVVETNRRDKTNQADRVSPCWMA